MIRRAARQAAWWLMLAGVAMGAGVKPLPKLDRVMTMDVPRVIGDMVLTDQDGAQKRISDLRGVPTLVFFGFTHCPDVCPTTLQRLALVKKTRAKQLAGLRVAFISVDGERDTPPVLKEYLRHFSPDFVGLTAPADQVHNLALSFAAAFFKDPPKDGEYLVQHSTRVYALDKRGRLRAELYEATPDAVAGIGRALLAE